MSSLQEHAGSGESIIDRVMRSLPRHIQDGWISRHPIVSALRMALEKPDEEAYLTERSKITPQELLSLQRLKDLEQSCLTALETHKQKGGSTESFFHQEYAVIKKVKRPEALHNVLALSLTALKAAHAKPGQEFEPWDTQRLALLRMGQNLVDDSGSGLLVDLPTGMGKTNVILPAFIPVALWWKPHVDVTSLTPLSRNNNARRFAPIAKLMGINSHELTETTSATHFPGFTIKTLSATKGSPQTIALKGDVTFALPADIAHYVIRHQLKKDSDDHYIQEILRRERNLVIRDEIDTTAIDEAISPMIISGPDEPIAEIIQKYWKPDEVMHQQTEAQSDFRTTQESHHKYEMVLRALQHEVGVSKTVLQDSTDDPSATVAFALLRRFFSSYESMKSYVADLKNPRDYTNSDGSLTPSGELDVYRRLYQKSTYKEYNPIDTVEESWQQFFSNLFPVHVTRAINEAIALRDAHGYFVDGGKVVVREQSMGWPKERHEFDPMTLFAIYALESLDHPGVKPPKFLHGTRDQITSVELDALHYSKTIGLTGTGVPAAWAMRALYGIEVTRIPPQFPDAVARLTPYVPMEKQHDPHEVVKYIQNIMPKNQKGDFMPILIDAPSDAVQQAVVEALRDAFPNLTIQPLSAQNSQEASRVFEEAGQKNTISVVVLMAGREVDVPVDDELDATGGLHVIALEPRRTQRQERQLRGRTGRQGKAGTVAVFVHEDNRVFASLSTQEKKRLVKTIRSGNQPGITHWIKEAQKRNELADIDELYRALGPVVALIPVRRRLAALSPDQKVKIAPFWPDILSAVRTNAALLPYYAPIAGSTREQHLMYWSLSVNRMFDEIVYRTSLPWNKQSTSTPEESVRRILDDFTKYIGSVSW